MANSNRKILYNAGSIKLSQLTKYPEFQLLKAKLKKKAQHKPTSDKSLDANITANYIPFGDNLISNCCHDIGLLEMNS